MKKTALILVIVCMAILLSLGSVSAQSIVPQPGLRVKKSATPYVYEPGGMATFTVVVQNSSNSDVTITSLIDDIHGDLNGQGTCSVPQFIPAGWTYVCTFDAQVNGNAGYQETDTATASGRDAKGNPVSASGSATVTVLDVLPAIAVVKSAEPATLPEPGGMVTFSVTVQNNSVATDPVTISSLVDSIHGDLNGQGTCSIPQVIQPGASYSCSFQAQVSGNAGYSETDTITASGSDDEGNPVSASDDAIVTITPTPPVIAVVKSAEPATLPEPGGTVTFTVSIQNNSGATDPVTITSLVDSIHGDLNGQGTCSIPQVIQPGASYSCSFQAQVSGNAGYSERDTVTASGADDEGTPVSASDDATVTITPTALPTIAVVKSAEPATLPEPGGTVTFTVTVQNNSSPTNPVTITSLVDSIHGDLNGQGTCSVPQVIQPGASYSCSFQAQVSGNAGYSETDTVTASGSDNEGNPVSASDDATVTITPAQIYHVYMPIVANPQPTECAFLANWQVTVGYEDLPTSSDYDYNDWVAEIIGRSTYDPAANCQLTRMEFQIDPKARGAAYDHAFHLLIPANVFASNATATLTIYDQNHNVLSSTTTPFNASQSNDYLIFAHTLDVLPAMANTTEGSPYITPMRSALLTLQFANPIPFDPTIYDFAAPRGTGLFFDPYLHVINWNGEIHRGSFKMLSSPELNWMWSEERHPIWQAYPMLTYQPGPPENILYPFGWWTTHNTCVYGDGIKCPLAGLATSVAEAVVTPGP